MSKPFIRSGFTIVELLIVIVVIGILATIAIVSYSGITKKAIGVSLQSDLKNASTQLKIYQAQNGTFPTTNDCNGGVEPVPPAICLRSSTGNSFGSSYVANNSLSSPTFTLTATNGDVAYTVTDSLGPYSVLAFMPCPTGFIVVPGSGTYGTTDFCGMKYEAKMSSATVPVSQAAGLPWVSISQTDAATYSQNVAGCTGCHLITEAQWLTIAQNVLNVPSNWIGGVVGSGSVYRGNSDSSSGDVIAADGSDANGYAGTGNVSPSNQRRTLTLSNGEVIWDMGGNATEWTNGTSVNGQPGLTGESTFSNKDWPTLTVLGSLSPDPSPTATGIAGASTWNSSNGIGVLYSNSGSAGQRSFLHGGNWNNGGAAGILGLSLNYAAGSSSTNIGFRAAR